MRQSALFTDFYSLTMAHGYWKMNMNRRAVFEMFFRRNPFSGGFSVFAGLEPLLQKIQRFAFSPDDIEFLKSRLIFDDGFFDYLRDFRFRGSLWAMDEGRVVFPQEPLIRVDGGLVECQILEGLILNSINFSSLVATKTARVWLASGKGAVMEFGLRRAQGPDGAMSASRSAYIGGAFGTSNVLAGKEFGIPVLGTMAHSWVMSFPGEEEAFRAYADIFPKNPVFLIDTVDTLRSGVPAAIKVGKELAARGVNFGVRLDSGDIDYLSREVRRRLDDAGLPNATISVSNDLDEFIIQTLHDAGAPVNSWGVGTQMVTGGTDAAFTGVYKLMGKYDGDTLTPTIKFSDNPEKTTTPGMKQVWRVMDKWGQAVADVLSLEGGETPETGKHHAFWHTSADYRHFYHVPETDAVPLLKERLRNGEPVRDSSSLDDIRALTRYDLETFDGSYKRIMNPHVYKVSIMTELRALKLRLINNFLGGLS
ncbi:MAG: nicotinate phosphoribosyltransferase [Spirochaetaceae bacterium]|jgi:nicotinate phosphoribosyltransferase|nr:nicotinate phosphoribosyltransferase [Spirochaetaceae bacterium]